MKYARILKITKTDGKVVYRYQIRSKFWFFPMPPWTTVDRDFDRYQDVKFYAADWEKRQNPRYDVASVEIVGDNDV